MSAISGGRLQRKLLRLVILLQVAVLLPLTVVMVWLGRQSVLSQATADGEVIAHLLAHSAGFASQIPDQVEDLIGQQMLVEATIAAHMVAIAEQAGLTRAQIWGHIESILRHSSVFSIVVSDSKGFCYLDFPGHHFQFSPDPVKQPEAHEFWGLLTGEKTQYVGKAVHRDSDGVYAKYAAVAGIDKPRIVEVGEDANYLLSLRDQVGLQRLLDELVGSRNILALQVVNADLTRRASKATAGLPTTLTPADEANARQVLQDHRTVPFLEGNSLKVMAPVMDGDQVSGVAIVYLSTAELRATMARQLWLALALSAVLMLAGCLLTMAVTRSLVRPIGALREGAVRVRAGDYTTSVQVRTDDELALLGDTFNQMVAEIRTHAAELESKVQQRTAELQDTLDRLRAEERKSEQLLLNVLPAPIAERLKESPASIADSFPEVTVMFADIVGFTGMSAGIPAHGVVQLLNQLFSSFDALAEVHGVEKIKTIGDAYMAVAGLPTPRPDHAHAIAELAFDMLTVIDAFNRSSPQPLSLRIGIHTGPVVAGVIGRKRFIYDLWGDTVNTASRMETHGLAGSIQITDATREALGDDYVVEPRGLIPVKGKGTMQAWMLLGRKRQETPAETAADHEPEA